MKNANDQDFLNFVEAEIIANTVTIRYYSGSNDHEY